MKIFRILLSLFVFLYISSILSASYEDALKMYNEGNYQGALTHLASILDVSKDMESGSSNYKIRFLAAHCHWKMKNYTNALAHLKRCSDIESSNVNPLIDIALILIDTNKYGEAETYGRKIITIDKNNSMGYYVLGLSKLKIGNYWGAKEFFEKSTSLDVEQYAAWNGLGKSLMLLNKYMEANTAFSTASALNPQSAEIYSNLAMSYYKLEKNKEAVMYINKALEIEPENEILKNNQKQITGE